MREKKKKIFTQVEINSLKQIKVHDRIICVKKKKIEKSIKNLKE